MLTPDILHVWRIHLDRAQVPPPTPGESARAARFRSPELAARYLKSHGALRAILARYTSKPVEFALREKGKPYLPLSPEIRFNLSHSHEMGLIAVALDIEVGVDVEKVRPLPQFAAIAERFFPPSEPAPANEADFFRRWTRIEALLKATGVGLYGASIDPHGSWTVHDIGAPEGFAAAVAAESDALTIQVHDYGDPA
jgi:4'-phosphopantetheinyl transferase